MTSELQSYLSAMPFSYIAALKLACLVMLLSSIVCLTNKRRWQRDQ